MFNTKKIIILGIVGLVLLSVILVFSFNSIKTKDKNIEKIKNEKVKNNKDKNNNKSVETEEESNAIIDEKLFEKLKSRHPEFSSSQLEFYRETAKRKKGIIIPCEGRGDEDDCIASVAFLKSMAEICGEIKDLNKKNECVNSILQEK